MRARALVIAAVALTAVLVVAALAAGAAPALATRATAPAAEISISTPPQADAPAGAQAPDATVTAPVAIQTVEPKAAPASAALDMRHLWQSLNNCGPASVVMALSTFGITADQETARLALRGPDVRRGMGPQGVDPWVKELYGLRSMWRNNGTNGLLKQLVANGFAPLVTQWMQDPSVSRIAHWRAIRGYDDALGTFYVNDPMLGNFVPLSYRWIQDNWQPFSYRYMVIYRPEDEALLKAIVGPEWSESRNREAFYQRTKAEALAQDTAAAWLTYGEASYQSGRFDEALAAFDKGLAMGNAQGVFTLRSSYPQTLRALGKQREADAAQAKLSNLSAVPSSTVASPPDSFAVWMAFRRTLAFDTDLPSE